MATCCCLGPQNGQPLCPCQMRAAEGWIAPRTLKIWHMHIGAEDDPKATSYVDAPMLTCIGRDEF